VSVPGADPGNGALNGERPDYLCNGESDSRNSAISENDVIATGRSDYPNQINNVLAFLACFVVLRLSGSYDYDYHVHGRGRLRRW